MKQLLILLTLMASALSFECPDQFGYHPDIYDCGAFYQCSHWTAYRHKCPSVLHFNPNASPGPVCDWPQNVKCTPAKEKPTTTKEPTTTTMLTTTMKPTTTSEPTTTTVPTTTAKPPRTPRPTTTPRPPRTPKPTRTPRPPRTPKPTTSAPTTTEEPTTTEQPTTTEKPTTTHEPTTTEEPITTAEPTTAGPPTTTCRPRDSQRVDPWNPQIIVTPGEDGDCEIPPVMVPIFQGSKINITVTFKLESHPLDVYYLMDFSGSMGDDKANLVRLSSALVSSLENMTSNFNLGFGAHVDKPVYPLGGYRDYSVQNRMPLTSDYANFSTYIQETPLLSGSDWPESAGDALAQVGLCGNRIGWRSNTRRLVILATDANFHVAGDGAVANITAPFEKRCRLDGHGYDPEELDFDYASIDQVAEIANENGMTVIFAVTGGVKTWYEKVADKIRSSAVGVLSSDSSNIISLVEDVYHRLEKRVELESESYPSKEVKYRFFSSCGRYSDPVETTICEELGGGGGEVSFVVEVDVSDWPDCPSDPEARKQKIALDIVGLPMAVEINLGMTCGE